MVHDKKSYHYCDKNDNNNNTSNNKNDCNSSNNLSNNQTKPVNEIKTNKVSVYQKNGNRNDS